MVPPDGITPISPYAPGKPVVPHQQPPKDREERQDDGSKTPTKKPDEDAPLSPESETNRPEKSGPGVDRYA